MTILNRLSKHIASASIRVEAEVDVLWFGSIPIFLMPRSFKARISPAMVDAIICAMGVILVVAVIRGAA